MPKPSESVSFSEIADIVSTRTNGELPLIVGGQAVNIWALAYQHRAINQFKVYAPFLTKDVDLCGPKQILNDLAKKYGVTPEMAPPRLPSIGHVLIPRENSWLKVELLAGVRGLRQIETDNAVVMKIQGTEVRVLDAISCLKAKITNAAELDQSGRQDVKHIQIMKLCAREFATDMITQGNQKQITERVAVDCLENLHETVTTPQAQKVTELWKITFDDVLPIEAIRQSTMEKVKNFAHYRLEGFRQQNEKTIRPPQRGYGIGM